MTPIDIVVLFGIFVLCFIGFNLFVPEQYFGTAYSSKKIIMSVLIVLVITACYGAYRVLTNPNLEPSQYEQYLGKYEKIISIGSGRYPKVVVKTSAYTLRKFKTDYLEGIRAGDKIYYRVEGKGNEIRTMYVVGGRRFPVSVCYHPMGCWDRMMEKYGFET